MYIPAKKDRKPHPWMSYEDDAILLAKFRTAPDLTVHAICEAESDDVRRDVLVVEKMLTYLHRVVELNLTTSDFEYQSAGAIDDLYYQFNNAAQTIFSQTTAKLLADVVQKHLAKHKN